MFPNSIPMNSSPLDDQCQRRADQALFRLHPEDRGPAFQMDEGQQSGRRLSSTLQHRSGNPNQYLFRNQVTANVRAGAEAYGRVFAVMYDISGQNTNTLIFSLTNDWTFLANTMHVTNSPRYLQQNGKPVVAIWGFGFSGRPDSPQQAQFVIDWFKAAGCTIMGGLPTNWRLQPNGSDTQTNAAWAAVFRSFDIISPWAVDVMAASAAWTTSAPATSCPTWRLPNAGRPPVPARVFPGFSWTNEQRNATYPLNQTPPQRRHLLLAADLRRAAFRLHHDLQRMYDECDEGTAMYKLVPTAPACPRVRSSRSAWTAPR